MTQAEVLDAGEEAHLIFMREEEKLARDVYLTLADLYPEEKVFANIAESEQTHTDTIFFTLEYYRIDDPNPDTNNLPGSIGVFTGEEYGAYFTDTFEYLVGWGAESLLQGLYVGAFIEELDVLDIVGCPHEIVDADNDIGVGECGLEYTDEARLQTMYTNLLEASKNHLRAYVKNIERIIGEGEYEAQMLSQEEVDEILGR
ncbi:MAG: DUF2202 domain-containing protein [Desulfurivibrionaceae bacterium]|nr:DUF2202 domain-containing protein [Desulfurivibrionaceae bacterium]